MQWREVQSLYGYGPNDRVFVVELEDDGSAYVRFGDGVIGARLPTGAQVTADYRHGLGTGGAGRDREGTQRDPRSAPGR